MNRESERSMRGDRSKINRKHKASIDRTAGKRLMTCFLLFVTIVGLSAYMSSFFVSARDGGFYKDQSIEDSALSLKKESVSESKTIYKTIRIQEGDTLWSIATAYMTDDYDSVDSYIAELRNLNSLKSDELYTNHYLMVSCSQ